MTRCLKDQPCDVIKMREMRGEVGKKTIKKYETSLMFETIYPVTKLINLEHLFAGIYLANLGVT